MTEEKKKVLKEIITSEEDILLRLRRLVGSAKLFIKVEEKTGRVNFSTNFRFTNADKIFLLLLGKYFAMHYGILKDHTLTLGDITTELGIKRTTLPAPLMRLIENRIVDKPEENAYRVNPYRAEYTLDRLKRKYLEEKGDSRE